MYGTMARMQPQAGKREQLLAYGQSWTQERGHKVAGFVKSYLLVPDGNPSEVVLVAVFADKASYVANANDPEQDRWYQGLRALLAADPTWEDGEISEG